MESGNSATSRIVVVGAGLMGMGIAQVAIQTGHDVSLVDQSPAILTAARAKIARNVARKTSEEGDADRIMARLRLSDDLKEPVRTADLVIEAIVEDLQLKKALFKEVDDTAPPAAILASNTSTLSITELASCVKRPEKFVGLHFFNPATAMKLLEVIPTEHTSRETLALVEAWGARMGKVTVVCKDRPGFIVNRLLIPMLGEAVHMLESGVACKEEIDTAMRLGAGHPLGPLQLLDHIGLDLYRDIVKSETIPGLRESPIVNELIQQGKLGKKSGEGFYNYS